MAETDIDYKTLYEKVSEELTATRIALFRIRNEHRFSFPDGDTIKEWIHENYLVIIAVLMMIPVALSVMDFIGRNK